LTPDQAPRFDEATTVHENPETAPRIPLGRSASTRQGGGAASHKRASSDWPAASVVTSMYKGPSPGISGPASPGLGSPTAAGRGGSFFGARSLSGNQVPTIEERDDASKENQMPPPPGPHRDSKMPPGEAGSGLRSNRNSVVSNPGDSQSAAFADPAAMAALTGERSDLSSGPSSPPRSTTSSGDRENRAGAGGSIMMGSKPRPLRLVQATATQDENKAANRGSWFGWMNKGAAAAGGLMPGRSISGESGQQNPQQQQ
jgi:hypothetical protein